VDTEQRFAWLQEQPQVAVSPDTYILEPPPPTTMTKWTTWNTWEHQGQAPLFAVEIVSTSNWRKDYEIAPQQYLELGVEQWMRIDLDADSRPSEVEAQPLTLFRRVGPTFQVSQSRYALFLDSVGLWVVHRPNERLVWLSEDKWGTQRLLSDEEWADAEAKRANREAERANQEAQLKQQAEERANQEARLKQQAEERANQEAQLKQQAEERAALETKRANQEARLKQQAEERADHETQLKQQAEAEIARLKELLEKARGSGG